MAGSIKVQRIAKLIQIELASIFLKEAAGLLGNVMITVTEVCVSPDLGLAKIYLSCLLNKTQLDDVVEKVGQQKRLLRKLLGSKVGNKLCKVPELRFYADNSAEQAAKIHRLLDGNGHT